MSDPKFIFVVLSLNKLVEQIGEQLQCLISSKDFGVSVFVCIAGIPRSHATLHLKTVPGISDERRVPRVRGHLPNSEVPRFHRARQGAALREEEGHPSICDEGDETDARDETRQHQQVSLSSSSNRTKHKLGHLFALLYI